MPAFHAEADRLRSLGYFVINPAEINADQAAEWHECMRADIAQLVEWCSSVFCLPGWEKSRGATLEVHIAKALGMRVAMAADITKLEG